MRADIAIEEIREVRHRISAEFDHDLDKYFAFLQEESKKYQEQINRFREMTRAKQESSAPALELRERPKD
jgi:hypothetical protein